MGLGETGLGEMRGTLWKMPIVFQKLAVVTRSNILANKEPGATARLLIMHPPHDLFA